MCEKVGMQNLYSCGICCNYVKKQTNKIMQNIHTILKMEYSTLDNFKVLSTLKIIVVRLILLRYLKDTLQKGNTSLLWVTKCDQ